jgi:sugar O-acyltransferase (sialic acid O-acetyltransferase NeuD family)
VTDLVLVGASGLAREALAVIAESGSHRVLGVLDDAAGRIDGTFSGVPVLAGIDDAHRFSRAELLVCVGSGVARERIVGRLAAIAGDVSYATVVDPSVRNPAACSIGVGSILLSHVSITAAVTLGDHVVVMPGTTLTHDDAVDDFATLAAGVSLGGGVHIARAAYLGMNAAVLPGVRVGSRAVVGMGAVVLSDVPDGETWAGVPARRLPPQSDRLVETTASTARMVRS